VRSFVAAIAFAAFVLAGARTASADPVLDQVTTTTARSGVLTIAVETTLAAKGEVVVSGDVNGKAVLLRKRMKASHRTLKFAVDPRRLRLGKKLTVDVHFALSVMATELGSAVSATQNVTADAPVPCVILPGLGDEQTPGGFAAFATALDAVAGGRYALGAKKPFMVLH